MLNLLCTAHHSNKFPDVCLNFGHKRMGVLNSGSIHSLRFEENEAFRVIS